MRKLGNTICKNRIKILIITLILFVPAIIGMEVTKINYDILVYLPEDNETVIGQNILADEFDMGAFSVTVINNMTSKEILTLESKIKEVDSVSKVVSTYDLIGTTIPLEALPSEVVNKVKKDGSDLLLITFKTGTSAEETLSAVEEIRELTKESAKIGGMSAMVLDTMNLSEREIFIYIIIAVVLCIIVLVLSLDSYVVPFLLLINIGISILFNLGTNVFFGSISYITKALVAVLQLGVTTDFSIFLYHSYEKNKKTSKTNIEAMSNAIHETFTSVVGSSLTTIAGFLVLCTMKLTLGMDLGLVMAKGVLLGVICVLTVFPSLILVSEKLIEKTKHKSLMPNMTKLNNFIIKHYKGAFALFLILIIPAYLANSKVDVYYKLDKSLPDNLDCIVANTELKEKFNIVSPEIILLDKSTSNKDVNNMVNEISYVDGIDLILSSSELDNLGLSKSILSSNITKIFESDNYQIIFLNSTYEIASDELNNQVDELNKIIKKYDEKGILAGEGPLMKDLVTISNQDFQNVNASSIICILLIMLIVLKSLSLPILLISVIEFAIFINMAIPYFSGLELPFVAPIVLGTIQLGATIDYAILMTTTYINKRKSNIPKLDAIKETLDSCTSSIIVSGLCFFGATFGVGVYSGIDMISSLCTLISRGALISMIVVLFVLPGVLLIFDKLICKTTLGFKKKEEKKMKQKIKKVPVALFTLIICLYSFPVNALVKDETVYAKLNNDGSVKTILVNEHLINKDELEVIEDETDLLNILNINGDETFEQIDNKLTWNAKKKDIYYQGSINKDLPITEDIKYYLNGEEQKLNEILGKNGNVKIEIEFANNDKHVVKVNGKNETLYTPFVTATGLILNGENNSNIIVNNGKVINNGKNYMVVGISSPGLYESLKLEDLKNMNKVTIEFDTTKFELSNIYTVVTPKIIEKEDLKIFDKMDELYKNVDTLKESIDQIEEGTNTLLEGAKVLDNGASSLTDGLLEVKTNLEKIKNGNISLDAGITEILSTLTEKKKLLDLMTPAFVTEKVAEGLGIINNPNITNTNLKTSIGASANAINDMNSLISNIGTVITNNNNVINELMLSPVENKEYIELLTTYNTVLGSVLPSSLSTTMDSLINALTKLKVGSSTLSNGTTELYKGVETLYSGSKTLKEGTTNLYNGVASLQGGISKYNAEGITKIYDLVNTKVKSTQNKLESLIELGENYQTFTMNKNGNTGETKFILTIDGEKVKETKVTKQAKVEKQTLWTRIKNLFK